MKHSRQTLAPLHVAQIPPKKWGIRDVTVEVFLLLVPIHGAGTREKRNTSRWNNQFSLTIPTSSRTGTMRRGVTASPTTKMGR